MFSMPKVTKNLLIINILAFIAMYVFRALDLNNVMGLHFFLAHDFHLYQLFTYMFMHANIEHIFFNMFALWMFGCVVERVWGAKRFLVYYFICGIGAGISQEIAQFVSFYITAVSEYPDVPFSLIVNANQAALGEWTTVGASGAIYGILLAFGMLFPEERIFIFPLPIPIKAKWFVFFYAAVELFSAIATPGDNVAHFAHLGGMVFGFFLIRYWQRHPGSNYGYDEGEQFFGKLRRRWEQHSRKKEQERQWQETKSERTTDWEYNARKKERQEETDRILDKIRRSGYDSLTAEEKRRLFENGRQQ